MRTKIFFIITILTALTSFSQKKWTLKQCVEHALENNITIKQNKLSVKASNTNIKSAKGNFLPTVSASTSGNLNFGTTFNPISKDRNSTSNFGGSIGINSGITIFNGFRNSNIYKQAKLGVKSSELNLKIIQNDVTLQIINAYLSVLFAKENVTNFKVQSEISTKQITRVEELFKAGAAAKADLLNIKSSAANDIQNLVTSENNLNLALLGLTQLIQVSSENFDIQKINTETISETLLYDNYEKVYKKALENRPEIKQGKLNMENADLNIELAKSGYLPTITASGSVGTNYGYNLNLPQGASNTKFGTQLNNNLGYGLGFNVSIPIFNGFKNDANVEKAKINREISSTQLEGQKLQLEQTIQQAYLDAKLALKTYENSKVTIEAQKEAFKNAEISYNLGRSTIFDFDQVRNRLANAEATMISAKYDYAFKSKVLQFYFGENILE